MNSWFTSRGMVNPYEVTFPPESLEAAQQIAGFLNGSVLDLNKPPYNNNPNVIVPDKVRYAIKSGSSTIYAYAYDLAGFFNNDSPDQLRVDLNRYGITALGPPPLGSTVSYESNYSKNPTAKDPGPLPGYAKPKTPLQAANNNPFTMPPDLGVHSGDASQSTVVWMQQLGLKPLTLNVPTAHDIATAVNAAATGASSNMQVLAFLGLGGVILYLATKGK